MDVGVNSSPHSAWITLLYTLSGKPHFALCRLTMKNRRLLLDRLFDWICGGAKPDSEERTGPHPSVVANKPLMKKYAGLLSALLEAWAADMEVRLPLTRRIPFPAGSTKRS